MNNLEYIKLYEEYGYYLYNVSSEASNEHKGFAEKVNLWNEDEGLELELDFERGLARLSFVHSYRLFTTNSGWFVIDHKDFENIFHNPMKNVRRALMG